MEKFYLKTRALTYTTEGIRPATPRGRELDKDIALYLAEVKAYKSGMVELRYEVRG